MDYSAVASEADALHGSSPWGSSSPRASRGFAQAAPDSPESPQPIRGHSYNQSQDSIPDSPYLPPPDQTGASVFGDNAIPGEAVQGQQPAGVSQHSQAPALHQHEAQPGQPGQPGQQHTGQRQQRPGAARYHSARQNRPVPQYKLQAKVTALERSGRKDPVFRFDVYVRYRTSISRALLTGLYRPTSPNSAPPNSGTSVEHMENSSSSPTT
jgi:hypothetical protein